MKKIMYLIFRLIFYIVFIASNIYGMYKYLHFASLIWPPANITEDDVDVYYGFGSSLEWDFTVFPFLGLFFILNLIIFIVSIYLYRRYNKCHLLYSAMIMFVLWFGTVKIDSYFVALPIRNLNYRILKTCVKNCVTYELLMHKSY